MRSEKIDGIGSMTGGEYDSIQIDGIGKLKGDAKANQVSVDGILRSKGKIEAAVLNINGIHKAKRSIKVKEMHIDGILNLKKAALQADKIKCTGALFCNREVNADVIDLQGIYNISHIYGDSITLTYEESSRNIPGRKNSALFKMLFGFSVPDGYGKADYVECTSLCATNTKFKTIRAGSVSLSQNCEADKLYCDGPISIDASCKIGEIISKKNQEEPVMANITLTKILDLYKEDKITAEEAEKMIGEAGVRYRGAGPDALPDKGAWPDDGKLRIMAFIGHTLLKKGAPEERKLEITYNGEALDVISAFQLKCGSIKGNADAGTSIECGDVNGNVNAGTKVKCENVSGSVSAGTSVTCNNIGNNATAGSSITCGAVAGQATAGGNIHMGK
ncbi:MAG: hypothetical protein ACLSVG_03405 [Clostridia bacterium]